MTFKQEHSDTQLKAQSKAQLAACGRGDTALAKPFPEHIEGESSEHPETKLLCVLTDFFHPADAHDRPWDTSAYKAEMNLILSREQQVAVWGGEFFINSTKWL